MSIPKVIHYCWFGGNPLPELAEKCIASWKKYFTGYEIKEWNESNYDVHKIPYIDEAYSAKKYAFVSDYARFDILYQYGGIYFDTDVEVIKPFDDILKNGGFMGFESIGSVATGLGIGCNAGLGIGCNAGLGIGCNAGLGIVYQILEFYATLRFVNSDGSYNEHTIVEYVTGILKKNGLKDENIIQQFDGFIVYPTEYFCPKSFITGKLEITKNTYSIHHYDSSWYSKEESKLKHEKWMFYEKYGNDEYLVDVFNKLRYYENRYKDFDIENISLKQLYKIIFRKTIKKILGNKFDKPDKNLTRQQERFTE